MKSGDPISVEERVLAYLDGDLDSAASDRVRALIDSSDEARTIYEAYAPLYQALEEAAPALSAPELDLFGSIAASLDDAEIDPGFTDYDTFYADTYRRLSDELEGEAADAFDKRLTDSPVHAEAFEAVRRGVADLERLGDVYRARMPRIDVVDAVMDAISPAETAPTTIVPFAPRRGWAMSAVAAAAIIAVMVGVQLWMGRDMAEVNPPMAQDAPAVEAPVPAGDPAPVPSVADLNQALSRCHGACEQWPGANAPGGHIERHDGSCGGGGSRRDGRRDCGYDFIAAGCIRSDGGGRGTGRRVAETDGALRPLARPVHGPLRTIRM